MEFSERKSQFVGDLLTNVISLPKLSCHNASMYTLHSTNIKKYIFLPVFLVLVLDNC